MILLDGTSTAEAPTNPAEEEGRSHLKKLEAAFAEANDDLERGLTRREDVDSARLKVATESQKGRVWLWLKKISRNFFWSFDH